MLLLLTGCVSSEPASEAGVPSTGSLQVRVVDGDGLNIDGVRHRLHGIDAPERDQTCRDRAGLPWSCGSAATQHLKSLVNGKEVYCRGSETDDYGRLLSTCFVDDLNLNASMVESGLALAYVYYSSRYVKQQDRARNRRQGLWSGEFVKPWDFRKAERTSRAQGNNNDPLDTPVKGNIGRKGTRYYHCPGDRSYQQTRISVSKGERWFRNAAEAEAAGWSRPPRSGKCR